MEFNNLIGQQFSKVKNMLESEGIQIINKDNNSGSRNFDTELVVRIKKLGKNKLEIITSKFLLNK